VSDERAESGSGTGKARACARARERERERDSNSHLQKRKNTSRRRLSFPTISPYLRSERGVQILGALHVTLDEGLEEGWEVQSGNTGEHERRSERTNERAREGVGDRARGDAKAAVVEDFRKLIAPRRGARCCCTAPAPVRLRQRARRERERSGGHSAVEAEERNTKEKGLGRAKLNNFCCV
jgi:hypothetical protein